MKVIECINKCIIKVIINWKNYNKYCKVAIIKISSKRKNEAKIKRYFCEKVSTISHKKAVIFGSRPICNSRPDRPPSSVHREQYNGNITYFLSKQICTLATYKQHVGLVILDPYYSASALTN